MDNEIVAYLLLGGAAVCGIGWVKNWVDGTSADEFDENHHMFDSEGFAANQMYFVVLGGVLALSALWLLLAGEA